MLLKLHLILFGKPLPLSFTSGTLNICVSTKFTGEFKHCYIIIRKNNLQTLHLNVHYNWLKPLKQTEIKQRYILITHNNDNTLEYHYSEMLFTQTWTTK